MASTGEAVLAWHGGRIATTVATSSTANFTTTETVTDTVVADLVDGARYLVEFFGRFTTTVAGDDVTVQLREDSLTGTVLHAERRDILASGIAQAWYLRAEHTATGTGLTTFVATGVRTTGSGNIQRNAAATAPVYLTVTHINEA